MQFVMILAFIGLILSVYAYRVTQNLKHYPNADYKPICEISNRVSCKRAFTSKESALFFAPNSAWGMFYYFFMILLLENFWYTWALYLSGVGLALSLYLGYILYYKQKNFCVVCWAIHAINLFLFVSILFTVVGHP